MALIRILLAGGLILSVTGCQTTSESETEQQQQQQQQQQQSQTSTEQIPDSGKPQEPSQSQESASADQRAVEIEVLSQALEAFNQTVQRSPEEQAGEQPSMPDPGNNGLPSGSAREPDQKAAASGQAGAQTQAEKMAVLDRKLENAYADFDGIIMRERALIKDKENAAGSTNAMPENEQTSSAGAAMNGVAAENAGKPTDSGGSSKTTTDAAGQYRAAISTSMPPADIPSGTDDDVVARQLREAAMREPDAELREKLWDEYRKYKKLPPVKTNE